MKPKSLTAIERQILSNQFQILAKLHADEEYVSKDYLNKYEILSHGFTGEYDDIFEVHTEEIPYETCEETNEILNMYRRINNAIASLTEEDKKQLDLQKIEFKGFDANNDPHYFYAKFMIENLEKWQEYKEKYLNSHSQIPLINYRRMLKIQNQLLKDKHDLNKDDLGQIINGI